jgi:hypothetical protein
MEFATEMILEASLYGAKIAKVPITPHPDGRKTHAPYLAEKAAALGENAKRFF